jgi:hypothetical protein
MDSKVTGVAGSVELVGVAGGVELVGVAGGVELVGVPSTLDERDVDADGAAVAGSG